MPALTDPVTEVRLITTNDPDAPFSIVDGVLDAGYGWGFKWTLQSAHFRFQVGDVANTDFYVRYALDPRTLHDRGPIRVTVTINGKEFDSFTDGVEGEHVHRRAADSLKGTNIEPLDVLLTVAPPWDSPDGKKLGIFLGAIGFVPRS